MFAALLGNYLIGALAVVNAPIDGDTKGVRETRRKPFDVLIEGLPFQSSRGNWKPLELFSTLSRGGDKIQDGS